MSNILAMILTSNRIDNSVVTKVVNEQNKLGTSELTPATVNHVAITSFHVILVTLCK